MNITETTDNVRKLIEEVEKQNDITKLKFLIYIFGLLNNNQINDKNEANPNLNKDDDMEIFTLESVGLSPNACTILLEYFAMLYNGLTNTKDGYEDNGNVLGINYDEIDKNIDSHFENLKYNEKLDVFSEIVIRYDNETYFKDKIVKEFYMKAKYRKIAVGGTFDKLHKGHEALLDAAFTMADEVLIGITSDDFASMKNHVIEPCEVRITKLKSIINADISVVRQILDGNKIEYNDTVIIKTPFEEFKKWYIGENTRQDTYKRIKENNSNYDYPNKADNLSESQKRINELLEMKETYLKAKDSGQTNNKTKTLSNGHNLLNYNFDDGFVNVVFISLVTIIVSITSILFMLNILIK